MIEAETKRLQIRRFEKDDVSSLYELTRCPETMKFVGDAKPLTMERTGLWVEKSIANYQHYGFGCFAVLEKTSSKLIGYCGFTVPMESTFELIYGIHKDYWGKGYGFEAANVMVQCARDRFHIERLQATVDPGNTASVRILEKLGMTQVESRLDESGLPEDLYLLSQEKS